MLRPIQLFSDPLFLARRMAVVATLCLCLFLAGCLERMFFKPDYSLTGLPPDTALAADIESTFKEEKRAVTLPRRDDDREIASTQAAETVRQQLIEKLHSLGYYDGSVSFTPADDLWSGTFALETGARYTIEKVTLAGARTSDDARDSLKRLKALEGLPLDAVTVLTRLERVRDELERESCRFGLSLTHTAYIDRQHKTADLEFTLSHGPQATLGEVTFEGQTTVKTSYLEKLVPWTEGQCYRSRSIEDLRGALFQTGLFNGVDIKVAERPAADGSVPVTVILEERPHRSFNAGVTYYSDEGPGLSLGWRHRNFLGGAETLESTLKTTGLEQSLNTTLTSPFFLRKDQKLTLSAGVKREDTDAYEIKSLDLGAVVTRSLTRRVQASSGVKFSISRIFDNATREENTFGLVSFPQGLTFDSRNSPLDATRGLLLKAEAQPFFNTLGAAAPFVKMAGTAQAYHTFGKDTTVALRAKIGSIQGASLTDVPATERFYTGGSGSVRGFSYQSIGPQNRGDPTGGRGLAEGSVEVRRKVTEDIGVVAFTDVGSLTEEVAPDFSHLSVGAGVGLRYYTAVGPLRFDIATPIKGDDQTADTVQFYISLGQAF